MAEQPRQRLPDFARPYADPAAVIIDLSAGLPSGELGPELGLPAWHSGRYQRATPDDWPDGGGSGPGESPAGEETLLVLPAGPDPARHLPLPACERALGRLPAGGQALLLLGYPPGEIPGDQLAGILTRQRCLVRQVTRLDHPALPAGLAVSRLGGAAAEREPAGDTGPDQETEPGNAALGVLNDRVLTGFRLAALQARLSDLERAGIHGAGLPGPADVPGPADRDRLVRALRVAQRELMRAHEELAALERSVLVALGRAVWVAARRPWPGAIRLPRQAYGLWRDHRARASVARPEPEAESRMTIAQDRGAIGLGDGWLAAYTIPGHPEPGSPGGDAGGLVIAGVLTSLACATLSPDAVVHPLLPHDADFVLETTGADLVLIESAALLPGSPWAYAADPAAPDRGRRLASLVRLAHSLGKPVILVRDTARHLTVGLDWLADQCDAVTEAGLGVQLARFNPVGLAAGRPCEAVYAGERELRDPPLLRRVLAELADGGQRLVTLTGYVPWRTAPELYRRNGLFLAGTAAQAREQLAAGARVVGPVGDGEPPPGACPAPDASRAAGEIKAAREAGARGMAEIMPILREIFEHHATPVRLAELARVAGLPGGTVPGVTVPGTTIPGTTVPGGTVHSGTVPEVSVSGRRVGVLAELAGPGEAGKLAAVLARQRLLPSEVVVTLTGESAASAGGGSAAAGREARARRAVTAALRPVTAGGAVIRFAPAPGLAAAAAAARSPWLAPWPAGPDQPGWYLLDLACAQECARADAVGFGPGPGYCFGAVASPALARRELLIPGAPPPPDWPARGLRTLSITRGAA